MAANRVIQELAHILRLLALAFWLLGLSTAFQALRQMMLQLSGPVWPWVTAFLSLAFFVVATFLWLESKAIKIVAQKPGQGFSSR